MPCNKQEFQLLHLANAGAEPSLLFLATEAVILLHKTFLCGVFSLPDQSINGTFPSQSLHYLITIKCIKDRGNRLEQTTN